MCVVSVPSQVLRIFAREEFRRVAKEHRAERYARGLRRFLFEHSPRSPDSPAIDLCTSVFGLGTFRRTKGSVKFHLSPDLTNQPTPALTPIARIYQDCWQTECLSRARKRYLKVEAFMGTRSQRTPPPALDGVDRSPGPGAPPAAVHLRMGPVEPGAAGPSSSCFLLIGVSRQCSARLNGSGE